MQSECALKRQKRAVEREEKGRKNQAALALLSLLKPPLPKDDSDLLSLGTYCYGK